MRKLITFGAALVLAGCSAAPQRTAMHLDTQDKKFDSPACMDIRNRALTYDDKVGERIGVGLATGLLLGPFGIPLAAAADAKQNEEREYFNHEIALRCSSALPPPPA
jgi:hypothetical protein